MAVLASAEILISRLSIEYVILKEVSATALVISFDIDDLLKNSLESVPQTRQSGANKEIILYPPITSCIHHHRILS